MRTANKMLNNPKQSQPFNISNPLKSNARPLLLNYDRDKFLFAFNCAHMVLLNMEFHFSSILFAYKFFEWLINDK